MGLNFGTTVAVAAAAREIPHTAGTVLERKKKKKKLLSLVLDYFIQLIIEIYTIYCIIYTYMYTNS